jgi:hypothetical protein
MIDPHSTSWQVVGIVLGLILCVVPHWPCRKLWEPPGADLGGLAYIYIVGGCMGIGGGMLLGSVLLMLGFSLR